MHTILKIYFLYFFIQLSSVYAQPKDSSLKNLIYQAIYSEYYGEKMAHDTSVREKLDFNIFILINQRKDFEGSIAGVAERFFVQRQIAHDIPKGWKKDDLFKLEARGLEIQYPLLRCYNLDTFELKKIFEITKKEIETGRIIRQLRWNNFYYKYPKSHGYFIATKLYRSEKGEYCAIEINNFCGLSCGSGFLLFFKLNNRKWEYIGKLETWTS